MPCPGIGGLKESGEGRHRAIPLRFGGIPEVYTSRRSGPFVLPFNGHFVGQQEAGPTPRSHTVGLAAVRAEEPAATPNPSRIIVSALAKVAINTKEHARTGRS
ncbi:uncharacterized protein LOC119769033 [Culex quinquefasciatus]|uniref:uncharacterized protein LOC119769033 n=1 Tax=Culex quinquefasciatus TaxID=7176 RepID=UPI0018E2F508|nr:uncharacterized protein LOC119769033 [Culex quinquefasciatus]